MWQELNEGMNEMGNHLPKVPLGSWEGTQGPALQTQLLRETGDLLPTRVCSTNSSPGTLTLPFPLHSGHLRKRPRREGFQDSH